MKKLLVLFFPVFLLVGMGLPNFENVFEGQSNMTTTTFKSTDGLQITADIYATQNPDAPWIILFHQAGYSRGEYRPIAPKLNEMGFNCMAIDQRSGEGVNEVENETHKAAINKKLKTKYPDAYPDLEAALLHVKNRFHARKMIIWGSSYSASLVFILASKHKSDVAAIAAFSPGEYFTFEEKKIADFAEDIECPVFITSSASEQKIGKIFMNHSAQKLR
jgi:predicted alpha/beta hydrolase